MTLTASTGAIAGTPTASGTTSFSATVTDHNNTTAAMQFSIAINPAALTIAPISLPQGTVSSSYSANLSATGGVPPGGGWTQLKQVPPPQ